MGWIKRHWFWYTHHTLHIDEQKSISKLPRKYTTRQLMNVMASVAVLNKSMKR